MVKVLLLQGLYSLSDEGADFQIRDRFSFMRFLDLHGCVPDVRTIRLFRERLKQAGVVDDLFSVFEMSLRARGILAMSGQSVDASSVQAPKRRNTKEEREALQGGAHIGRVAGQTGEAVPEGPWISAGPCLRAVC